MPVLSSNGPEDFVQDTTAVPQPIARLYQSFRIAASSKIGAEVITAAQWSRKRHVDVELSVRYLCGILLLILTKDQRTIGTTLLAVFTFSVLRRCSSISVTSTFRPDILNSQYSCPYLVLMRAIANASIKLHHRIMQA